MRGRQHFQIGERGGAGEHDGSARDGPALVALGTKVRALPHRDRPASCTVGCARGCHTRFTITVVYPGVTEFGGTPCQRKLPNTTRRLQNITPMRLTTMGKRPNITTADITRRRRTTLIQRGDTQRTPCTTAKKPPRLTLRNTVRNERARADRSLAVLQQLSCAARQIPSNFRVGQKPLQPQQCNSWSA